MLNRFKKVAVIKTQMLTENGHLHVKNGHLLKNNHFLVNFMFSYYKIVLPLRCEQRLSQLTFFIL